MEAVVFKQ